MIPLYHRFLWLFVSNERTFPHTSPFWQFCSKNASLFVCLGTFNIPLVQKHYNTESDLIITGYDFIVLFVRQSCNITFQAPKTFAAVLLWNWNMAVSGKPAGFYDDSDEDGFMFGDEDYTDVKLDNAVIPLSVARMCPP